MKYFCCILRGWNCPARGHLCDSLCYELKSCFLHKQPFSLDRTTNISTVWSSKGDQAGTVYKTPWAELRPIFQIAQGAKQRSIYKPQFQQSFGRIIFGRRFMPGDSIRDSGILSPQRDIDSTPSLPKARESCWKEGRKDCKSQRRCRKEGREDCKSQRRWRNTRKQCLGDLTGQLHVWT